MITKIEYVIQVMTRFFYNYVMWFLFCLVFGCFSVLFKTVFLIFDYIMGKLFRLPSAGNDGCPFTDQSAFYIWTIMIQVKNH